jgi:predicted phage-related endonuclease
MNHYTFNKPTHGSPEWLAVRWKNKDGLARISASTAAAVHNEHPFMSGAELAIQLLNEEPPKPEQENRAMQRGNTLEGPVRDWASQLLNDHLTTPCIMHAYEEDGVRLVATIDAVNEHGKVFEIKTKRGRWNGQLPRYWYWQGVQQAICANVDSITWVVFDSDLDIQFHEQVVTSDEKQMHISACRNFLAAIDMGMIPDGAQATYKDLSNLYSGNGTSVELNKDQAALVVSYLAAQNYISEMEKQADAIKTQLCDIMKDAETALVNGKLKATWRSAKRTSLDSKKFEAEHPALAAKYKKQTTYRTFRVVEGE